MLLTCYSMNIIPIYLITSTLPNQKLLFIITFCLYENIIKFITNTIYA
jgi:hypothetical protein